MKSKLHKYYNRKKDQVDTRDKLYLKRTLTAPLPALVDLRPFCSPVMDQGTIGSCTSQAGAGMWEYLELQDLKNKVSAPEIFDPEQFVTASRLFLYYNERKRSGTVLEDSGAQIRDICWALNKFGACPEPLWPYNINAVFNKPPTIAYSTAASHKVSNYYSVPDLEGIKDSLAQGFPVLIGITVYESFESESVAQTGVVPMPDVNTEEVLGGHAVLVVGYNDANNSLIVRNSWGQGWGDKGYFYLPYDFMNDPSLASDFWTIRA